MESAIPLFLAIDERQRADRDFKLEGDHDAKSVSEDNAVRSGWELP